MTEGRVEGWLVDMRTAIDRACLFTQGMTRESFLGDLRTQQAVAMNLVIVGEAVAKLIEHAAPLLARHPEIPWASVKGMRNRIAHGYFEVDMTVVWATVQQSLPMLAAALPAVIEDARVGGSHEKHGDVS